MAVGDVVGAVSLQNTALTFQPAAGVECVITAEGLDDGTGSTIGITDGTETAVIRNATASQNIRVNAGNMKVCISNSVYITFGAMGAGLNSAYTGIQIK